MTKPVNPKYVEIYFSRFEKLENCIVLRRFVFFVRSFCNTARHGASCCQQSYAGPSNARQSLAWAERVGVSLAKVSARRGLEGRPAGRRGKPVRVGGRALGGDSVQDSSGTGGYAIPKFQSDLLLKRS